jgi:amino acid transporter
LTWTDSEWEDSIVLKDGRRFPLAGKEKHVTTLQLLAVIYFCVVGGPYALEDAVAAASGSAVGTAQGAGWVILLLILMAFLVHLPTGLLTSELASAMPQNGGYIIWVSRAFGNFWGYLEGWLSWCSSVFDAALYPILVVAYLEPAFKNLFGLTAGFSWLTTYLLRVSFTIIITVLNVTNIQVYGLASLFFAAFTILPYFIYSIAGTQQIFVNSTYSSVNTFDHIFSFTDPSEVNWGLLISCILWVGSGWDSPGTVAGDVHRPRKTYPRAVYLAVILMLVTNLWPLCIAVTTLSVSPVSATVHWSSAAGFWATAAAVVGGKFLQYLVILVAVVGNFNLFNVLFTSCSWSLYAVCLPGLLDCGFVLKFHEKWRTPLYCMLLNAALIALCNLYTFTGLIQIAMSLNSLALLLECLSLVWLRVMEPTMKRPYKIPINTWLLAAFMTPTLFICIVVIVTIEKIAQLIVGGCIILGLIAYFIARQFERSQAEIEATNTGDEVLPYQAVDLNEVFEGIHDLQLGANPEDFPDFGLRTSAQVESLPELIYQPSVAEDNNARALYDLPEESNSAEDEELDDESNEHTALTGYANDDETASETIPIRSKANKSAKNHNHNSYGAIP